MTRTPRSAPDPLLEATVGKLIFRVATDRRYSPDGVWVKDEGGGRVRVGIADFPQQRNGDVAFADVKPPGTVLAAGEELGTIETIKVVVAISSPVAGTIREVNAALETGPEVINKDPYGDGWLAVIETAGAAATLLDAEAYFALMRTQAAEEAGKS